MAEIPAYPLYNRTYLLYGASPLHTGDAPLLNEQTLRTHAQRLTHQLKGDSIRGVEVDIAGGESTLPGFGPLERCSWDIIGDEDDWINRHRHLVDPDASQVSTSVPPAQARGVQVTLEYERNSYNALLLRDPDATASEKGFTSLPLLMLKMPAPLRAVFLNYLKTTFDTHVSPLRLQSSFLTSTLDTYFRHLNAAGSTQSIRDVVRQLQLQLSFGTVTSLLKHIDITISSTDVPLFVKRGKSSTTTPFTSALAAYIQKHLAIDLAHPQVHISKLTCASFTLSTDRLKLAVPESSDVSFIDEEGRDTPGASPSQLAFGDFYISLVREAAGTGRFLPESTSIERASSTPSTDGGNPRVQQATTRKRAISTTAGAAAPAKRSKPRGKGSNKGAQEVDMTDA